MPNTTKIIIIVLIVATMIMCTKEETHNGNNEFQINQLLENRNNNQVTLAKVFFKKSGTVSNYLISLKREYEAYCYGLVDTVWMTQKSSGTAVINYTNIHKMTAANYDIFIQFKSGVIDTLKNYLSEYVGTTYGYKPNPQFDEFHIDYTSKVKYVQGSKSQIFLPKIGKVQDYYRYTVFRWNGFNWQKINNEWYMPCRTFDYEFTLDNNP